MNLAQIRSRIYSRTGLAPSDPQLTTVAANEFANDAMHMIEAAQDWPWLQKMVTFTTTGGVDTYASSTFAPDGDWLRSRELIVPGDRPMEHYDLWELDSRWPLTTATGRPYEWAIDTDQIVLRPVPDGVYVVNHHYLRTEPDLVADTQSPLMPAKFHAAIAELGAWLALRQDHEEPRAAAALQAYQQWERNMRDDTRRFSSPGRVRVRPGGYM